MTPQHEPYCFATAQQSRCSVGSQLQTSQPISPLSALIAPIRNQCTAETNRKLLSVVYASGMAKVLAGVLVVLIATLLFAGCGDAGSTAAKSNSEISDACESSTSKAAKLSDSDPSFASEFIATLNSCTSSEWIAQATKLADPSGKTGLTSKGTSPTAYLKMACIGNATSLACK